MVLPIALVMPVLVHSESLYLTGYLISERTDVMHYHGNTQQYDIICVCIKCMAWTRYLQYTFVIEEEIDPDHGDYIISLFGLCAIITNDCSHTAQSRYDCGGTVRVLFLDN